jgi:hypothetical protein
MSALAIVGIVGVVLWVGVIVVSELRRYLWFRRGPE